MQLSARHRAAVHALFALFLLCGSSSCSKSAGPFITIAITGIPPQTPAQQIRLVTTVTLGDRSNVADIVPMTDTQPLTIDLPMGTRGALVIASRAVLGPTCMLAAGTLSVELTDDIAYASTLALESVPLTRTDCSGLLTYGLTVVKTESGGSGTIVSNPPGIDCAAGAACTVQTGLFFPGTTVKLFARPALGSRVGWSLPSPDCGVYRTCSPTVNQDMTVTATFTACGSASWCDEGAVDLTSDLHGVWGTSGGAIYAVGEGGTIAQRSSGTWAARSSGVTTALRAIGGAPGVPTVYAAGDNGTLLQLGGTTWTPVTHALLAGKQITGITSENYLGSINFFFSTADGSFIKLNGGNWSAITDTALTGKVLYGLASTNSVLGREATVVGAGGFILRWTNGNPPTRDNTNAATTTAALRGVWSGSGLTVAVGDNGTILTRGTGDYNNTKTTWTAINNPFKSRLNAVWGGDDTNIWIVGDGGVILKYDGNMTVTQLPNVPLVDLQGVWAADRNQTNVYAVGKNGVILHYLP